MVIAIGIREVARKRARRFAVIVAATSAPDNVGGTVVHAGEEATVNNPLIPGEWFRSLAATGLGT
jgi:hypothetical protein